MFSSSHLVISLFLRSGEFGGNKYVFHYIISLSLFIILYAHEFKRRSLVSPSCTDSKRKYINMAIQYSFTRTLITITSQQRRLKMPLKIWHFHPIWKHEITWPSFEHNVLHNYNSCTLIRTEQKPIVSKSTYNHRFFPTF